MNVNEILRAELISSLCGQVVQPYSPKSSGNCLSLDEFHLRTIVGNHNPYRELFLHVESFFDPQYDYNFENFSDSSPCFRGNEPYKRPSGWYRLALKVAGKYPDGDTWLGTGKWRNNSEDGEWPVSFHGTSYTGAKGIIKEHFRAGDRDVYGRGIYSTPHLEIANMYARSFQSVSTGKSYKVILQNRINPKERQICKEDKYWLIPVEKEASAEEERSIVERSIRPYGILIKPIGEGADGDQTSSYCSVA